MTVESIFVAVIVDAVEVAVAAVVEMVVPVKIVEAVVADSVPSPIEREIASRL